MNTKAKSNHETLLQAVLTELERANATLDIIAESLVNGHGNGPSAGPNFQRALPEYPTFDWESIGAEIVKWDRHGATVVKWQGLEFFRRRHTDYDASIWFSRYTGQKDENDRKVYARLITFSDRPRIVKGLPDEVTDRLPDTSPVASPPQDDTPSHSLASRSQGSAKLPTDTKRSVSDASRSFQSPRPILPTPPPTHPGGQTHHRGRQPTGQPRQARRLPRRPPGRPGACRKEHGQRPAKAAASAPQDNSKAAVWQPAERQTANGKVAVAKAAYSRRSPLSQERTGRLLPP